MAEKKFNPRGAPVPDNSRYDGWELTHRPAMIPFLGEYTNTETGEKAGGMAMPAMVTEPMDAAKRLFGEGAMWDVNNPQTQDDLRTILLTLYGGNALNPLARVPKGGLASGAVKQIGSLADFEAKRKALRLELGLAQLNADHANISRIRKAMDDLEAQTQKFNTSPEETNSLLDAALAKPKSGTDLTPEDQFFLDMLEKHTNKLLSDNRPSLMGSALAGEQGGEDRAEALKRAIRQRMLREQP